MSEPTSLIRVVTSVEAAARDQAAIAAGIPSRALMQRAGAATAAEIAIRFKEKLRAGVLVFAGPGNNGGDAWVVAGALAAAGVRVRVCEPVPAATDDARGERDLARPFVEIVPAVAEALAAGAAFQGDGIVVDGLLGTGSSGAPRGPIAAAVAGMRTMRERGAGAGPVMVALDVPTGVDATTGEMHKPARADVTFTYGTLKRGHLIGRIACGRVVVIDIGLGAHAALADGAPLVVNSRWVARHIPEIPPDAHKGTRKKLAIVGGGPGMTGAAILAARSAWRSGIGMVKLVVAAESLRSVQEAEPQSLTAPWPRSDDEVRRDITRWADVVAIGPGLGSGTPAGGRELVERILRAYTGPVVVDADAINAFSSNVNALAVLLNGRPAVLTPHPVEFARLAGIAVDNVLARRFDVAVPTARHTRAVVLLKGQPTVITAPDGERLATASGTPLLAAAGSGDLLTGMVGTLLGQIGDPVVAAACAAWVHGRAAWLVQRGRKSARGFSLDDVLAHLPRAWSIRAGPSRYPVLMELPDVMPKRA
ncbi:MAG: NAD(P)H-hydrate dehydratase [Gemmatimonadaceae bacterium]